jgi:hypothetical protein
MKVDWLAVVFADEYEKGMRVKGDEEALVIKRTNIITTSIVTEQ